MHEKLDLGLSQVYVLMNRPSGKLLALSLASVLLIIIYQWDSVQFLEAIMLLLSFGLKLHQGNLLSTCLP
jgi:hypothetical protein